MDSDKAETDSAVPLQTQLAGSHDNAQTTSWDGARTQSSLQLVECATQHGIPI